MSIDEMLLQQASLVGAMDEAVDDALPHEIAEIVKSQRKRVFIKITSWFLPAAAGALAAVMTVPAFAQANDGLVPLGMTTVKPLGAVPGGTLVLPTSSLPKPAGQARTHLQFVVPDLPLTTPFDCDLSPKCETPASLACVYLLPPYSSHSNGCDPNIVTTLANGGSRAIGIVDAFHDKNALADLRAFSAIFGLPSPNLTIIKCTDNSTGQGTCSTRNPAPPACQNSNQCGWAIEESLDLQAAHAMAPHAKIILVEAHSDSFDDMFLAEKAAGAAVAAAGGGEVSNSWGGSEFSGEQAFDLFFVDPKVAFLASTGDHKNNTDPPWSADVEYPSTSPNVVGVGGTRVVRDSNHTFNSETPWDNSFGGGGGGLSTAEPTPGFQSVVGSSSSVSRRSRHCRRCRPGERAGCPALNGLLWSPDRVLRLWRHQPGVAAGGRHDQRRWPLPHVHSHVV